MEYPGLKRKVDEYLSVLANTQNYRQAWKDSLREEIVTNLQSMADATGLKARILTPDKIGNAEAVVLTMGKEASGLFARVDEDTNKPLIKDFGSLVYQQLYNGKVQVLAFLPAIEGIVNPQPPQILGIYRPEELKPAYYERHVEEFIRMLKEWEDFDDDQPAKIGFQMPPHRDPSEP